MLKSVNVSEYMLQHPVKVRAGDSIEEAMQVIIDNKVSASAWSTTRIA